MQSTPNRPTDKAGRRRLLRAVPALTVLPSAPVLAANCKLPSGFSVSGNLSRAGGNPCSDPAPLPSAWAGMTHHANGKLRYKGTNIPTERKFSALFPGGVDDTLAEVLAGGNLNGRALFVSVRLQAIAGGGGLGFPSEEMVLQMWQDTRQGGSYSPTPGVSWQRDEVLKYLRYLTGQSIS